MDLNQDDNKPQEPKQEEVIHQTTELEAPAQPTPSQPRASPAVSQPQPANPQSQRIPSAQGAPQIAAQTYQPPAAFGNLTPGQAQRYQAPAAPAAAPGLSQSKDFAAFPGYDQQH